MRNITFFLSFLALLSFATHLCARSGLRKQDPLCPFITTRWADDTKYYRLRDSHFEVTPLFHLYDKAHFDAHQLPTGQISFRNDPAHSVSGANLSDMIENLLKEIYDGKTRYTNFEILKNRDFNVKKEAGLLVVRCKKYPFVIKLFMETPRSFIRPYHKGFEPACFFIIGGGSTRHFIGFTRVKNLYAIQKRLKKSPYWAERVDVPRKWFWEPKKPKKLEITGYNIGGHNQLTINVPGIYAIVTDEIKAERSFSLFNSEDRKTAIDICNYLLCRIDPHIANFLVEKETGKVLIIDTEHFPSLVGFKKRPRITSYTSWYLHLFVKFIQDRFCRTKKDRHNLQLHPTPPFSMP